MHFLMSPNECCFVLKHVSREGRIVCGGGNWNKHQKMSNCLQRWKLKQAWACDEVRVSGIEKRDAKQRCERVWLWGWWWKYLWVLQLRLASMWIWLWTLRCVNVVCMSAKECRNGIATECACEIKIVARCCVTLRTHRQCRSGEGDVEMWKSRQVQMCFGGQVKMWRCAEVWKLKMQRRGGETESEWTNAWVIWASERASENLNACVLIECFWFLNEYWISFA